MNKHQIKALIWIGILISIVILAFIPAETLAYIGLAIGVPMFIYNGYILISPKAMERHEKWCCE